MALSKKRFWPFGKNKTKEEVLDQAVETIITTEDADKTIENQTDLEHSEQENPITDSVVSENIVSENVVAESVATTEIAEVTETVPAEPTPKKTGFFKSLLNGLVKTKQNLGGGLKSIFVGKKIDDDLFDELEEKLLIADVGIKTTTDLINKLTKHVKISELKDANLLYEKLKSEMSQILVAVEKPLVLADKKPYIILMVGVNGVGKTTTIGKLAQKFKQDGKKVMLAAGDTFRAAAVEQLQVWGERNDVPVVAQANGVDAASVIFDAISSARAKNIDVLLADTAGRLQNKDNLIEELKKIIRVIQKQDPTAPHEIMLTLDATTGQNAISQTKIFNDAVGVTGINITKLDGSAKGGVIFAIAQEFNIPLRFIGVGEKVSDLEVFKAKEFVDALFFEDEADKSQNLES